MLEDSGGANSFHYWGHSLSVSLADITQMDAGHWLVAQQKMSNVTDEELYLGSQMVTWTPYIGSLDPMHTID